MKRTILSMLSLLFMSFAMAEDVLQVLPLSTTAGNTTVSASNTLSVQMVNTNTIKALQFDMYLPEGMTIRTTSAKLSTGRMPYEYDDIEEKNVFMHSVGITDKGAGHYFITCNAQDIDYSIKGNSGEIFKLYFMTSANMQSGVYPIRMENVILGIDGNHGVYPETSISYVKIGDPAPNVVFDLGEGYVPSFVESEMGNTANVVANGKCANLTLTDGYAFAASKAFTATNASYERTVANSWGTIMLPYAVESNETVTYYQLKEVDMTNGILSFEQAESVEANVPAVFKATGAKLEANAENVNIPVCGGNAEGATVSGLTLVGSLGGKTYESLDPAAADGVYFIRSNKFWRGEGNVVVSPFRACFEATSVSAMSFALRDLTETGIHEVRAAEAGTEIYDLNGIYMGTDAKTLPAGFYIVNGKKVIIKQ